MIKNRYAHIPTVPNRQKSFAQTMVKRTARTVLELARYMPEVNRFIGRWLDRSELSWEDALLASLGALEMTHAQLLVTAAENGHKNIPPLVTLQPLADNACLSDLERQNRLIAAVCSVAEQVCWLRNFLINAAENAELIVPKIDMSDILH